jgi:hypothetical protein
MVTNISDISDEILKLLKKNNGLFVFGDIQSTLNHPHDFVLMSLGWLLRKGEIQILEDPLRVGYKERDKEAGGSCEIYMYDLIVDNKFEESARTRVKNMSPHIESVTDKILTLVEGCEDLLALQSIKRSLHESREVILMGLGWLIGQEYIRGINSAKDILIYQVSKENDSPIDRVMRSENLICV